MLRSFASLVAFVALSACRAEMPAEPPFVVTVTSDGGAYTEPSDVSSGGYADIKCARACAHLQELGCPDGNQRSGEDSCYVVCRRAQATGKIDFRLDCVIDAGTAVAVRACGSYRCR